MTTTDIVSTPRERAGWYAYDWANSAFPTTVVTAFLGPYLTAIAKVGADGNGDIDVYGLSISAKELWPYVTSLSVILQVVVMPVVGAIADRTSRKKRLLSIMAYTGAASTCGLVFLTGDRYMLGAWLFLIANVSFGASVVVYNSFLPQIAAEPDRDKVSSRGWAIGYLGGGTLLLFNVIAVVLGGSENQADMARWSLVSAGVWWAGFTTLTVAWLRDRPALEGEYRGFVLTAGFKQFWRTLKDMRNYPLSIFFLIAFLVYNDGIQTVFNMAGTYGAEELGFELDALMPVILLVQFVAFGGAMVMGWLAKLYGAKATVLGSLLVWVAIVVFAYFVPAENFAMLLIMGVGIGLVLGGSQALSRSMFSQLIPKGKEGEYFGLYEISDRGTSWMGPLLFGLAIAMTDSYRIAILSLIVFFALGFVLLLLVPVRKAIIAAGNTPPAKV
ncbi:MFS transporter [Stackebrandtia nassauensis]|uniref:Major facilitator superfamily MFS_1 n=1 Tax=Stackebrandtia nassauensis (strain DSM 44728 / CIP 108903 / NRRL B-16338 / NBRC 102104 / LLR-40K-21) TaxID=446470 RepID=D3Q9G4_STANL|nr:MFS transporter [Stackebrandtia nassauensis]ADD42646.1 major facilitator superfamily MFS_1 [Stackebrandtia nassauensis DSM 44728]